MTPGLPANHLETMSRYFTPLPHHFRTFSTPFPLPISGDGAENVRRTCGDGAEIP